MTQHSPNTPAENPSIPSDPFLDEVRRLKSDVSARFDGDVERLAAHFKEIERRHRAGLIPVPSESKPSSGKVA